MSDVRLPLLKEHGVTHEWVDHGDGNVTVVSSQDVEPILDRNKAMQNFNDGYNKTRDMRRAASIPNVVLMQWVNEVMEHRKCDFYEAMRVINSDKFLKRKIDDGDNQYLRTAHLKIGM